MPMPRDPRGPGIFEIRDLPIIDTPFTRLCEPWFSTQKGGCADFEMDYVRCAARVGHKNVEKSICMKYMEDWMECAYKLRSGPRYMAMQAERKKQGLGYQKPPPPDSVETSF